VVGGVWRVKVLCGRWCEKTRIEELWSEEGQGGRMYDDEVWVSGGGRLRNEDVTIMRSERVTLLCKITSQKIRV